MNASDLVSALLSAIAVIASLVALRKTEVADLWRFLDEHRAVLPTKRIFWDGVRAAYQRFRESHPHLPEKFTDWIRMCPLPAELLECDNIRLYAPKAASDDQKLMFEFAKLVYPAHAHSGSEALKKASIVPERYSQPGGDFFAARSELADFWYRFCKRHSYSTLIRELPKEQPLLIILSWLDITHRQWTGEDESGRIKKMYRLALSFPTKK